MRALKAALISAAIVAAMLASGTVLAQSDLVKRPANSEIGAARQALDDAMAHLRKVRDPQNRENVRAMNFIKLAQQQLDAEGSLYPIN
jgi:hypothetical protein